MLVLGLILLAGRVQGGRMIFEKKLYLQGTGISSYMIKDSRCLNLENMISPTVLQRHRAIFQVLCQSFQIRLSPTKYTNPHPNAKCIVHSRKMPSNRIPKCNTQNG